jgi:SHO1 osmosensor
MAVVDTCRRESTLRLRSCQLIWILYLTSEEDSPFYRMFTAAGNGGLSGYNRRARVESTATGFGESPMPRQNGSGYGGGYGYTPAGVDTTPQKAPRPEYSQPLQQPMSQPTSQPALSDMAEPRRAKYVHTRSR